MSDEPGSPPGESDEPSTPDLSWEEVDRLLADALERSPEDRGAFLDERAGGNEALRARVGRLLEAAEASASFLDAPALHLEEGLARSLEDRLEESDPSGEGLSAGTRLGAYRIEGVLGRGGFGTVYRARRADGAFEQNVAVKVLRPGEDREELVRRFHTERQILAALAHPNIARILDGGTTAGGRPYLVMELVDGRPITEHCEEQKLTLRERLELFLVVARAVQHAHRNLVVHRDLKPSNILVDRTGEVRLLDFGIAKLLDAELLDDPAPPTGTHVRLLTPEYAAPEQVRGEAITTATDVYQLGLLLHQMLTGRSARPTRARTPSELDRIVCVDEPARPSRSAGSARLRRALRGDLDTIVLEALRVEPERRYASAGELAEDVARFLDGRPVTARPDRWHYRLRKLGRRHPVGAAIVAAILALGLVQVVTATAYAHRLQEERDVARQEAAKATEVKDFLVDLFRVAEPDGEAGTERTARDLLMEGVDRLPRLEAHPEIHHEVLQAVGDVFSAWGMWAEAGPTFQRALTYYRRTHGGDHPHVADALNYLGHVERRTGDLERAEALYDQAMQMRVRLFGREHPEVACSLNNLGLVESARGNRVAADALYLEALDLREAFLGRENPCVATILNNLAISRRNQGDLVAADSLHAEAVTLRRELLGPGHPSLAEALSGHGRTLRLQQRWEEAERALRDAIEIGRGGGTAYRRNLALDLNSLAFLYWTMGEFDAAVPLYEESLALRKGIWGERSVQVGTALNNLGSALRDDGRLEEARGALAEALELRREVVGEDSGAFAATLNNLGRLELAAGELDAAEGYFRRSLGIREADPGSGPDGVAEAEALLAMVLVERGELERAEATLRRAHEVLAEERGPGERATREVAGALSRIYLAWERPGEAERYGGAMTAGVDGVPDG